MWRQAGASSSLYLGLGLGAALLGGCDGYCQERRPPASAAWFTDVSASSGVHFVHDPGELGSYFFPQIMGSGAAVFDADGDGRLDLYLLHNAGPESASTNQLFLQQPDGRFINASAGSGADLPGYWMGVIAGDLNNDARNDLVITGYNEMRILVNVGGGQFKDATQESRFAKPAWGCSLALLDFDRDGLLDVAVADYVRYSPTQACLGDDGELDYCTPTGLAFVPNRLYRNTGQAADGSPVFEDVSHRSGLAGVVGVGLGVVAQDFTEDGWVDLLFSNDGLPNHLWVNQHDGTFREEGMTRGVGVDVLGVAEANMGIAIGDIRNSGLLDVFITHLPEQGNVLWTQSSPGLFEDRTGAWGLSNPKHRGTGFGTVFRDFDNDGFKDLALVNGRIKRPPPSVRAKLPKTFWGPFSEPNQLFRNADGKRFKEVSAENPALCGFLNVGRGLVACDIDDDGGVDLLLTQIGGEVRLLRNTAPRGNWLTVRAVDPSVGGRDALTSTVLLRSGTWAQRGMINPGFSYLVSSDPRAHFGLGERSTIDELLVTWPDGQIERFDPPAVNQVVTLVRGRGTGTEQTAAAR